MTTIGIAIPYWGDPSLLRRAVESVLAQDDPEWRLVVIDDAYPDGTAASWLSSVTDPRVRYVRNETNLGISANFRRAVDLIASDHVVIMGFDDVLLPNYVATVRRAISHDPSVDIVQPGVRVIGADGSPSTPLVDRVKALLAPRRQLATLRGQDLAASLLRGNWLYWPSLAFRTETIRRHRFREDLAVIQDLAILIDIALANGSLIRERTIAFVYRRHSGSASQVALEDGTRFSDERRYYSEAAALCAARGWRKAQRQAQLRLMSRLHAITELPRMLRMRRASAIRACLAHIFC